MSKRPKRYWVKFWHTILDDPDMVCLPANLWRLWAECLLLASRMDEEGFLPPLEHIAIMLRRQETTLRTELEHFIREGKITWRDYGLFGEQRLFIVNYARLQAPSPAAERKRLSRQRQREEKEKEKRRTETETDTYCPVTSHGTNVTKRDTNVTPTNGNGPNPFWNIPANLETPAFLNAWNAWMQYTDEAGLRFTPTTAATTLEDLAAIGPDDAVRLIRQGIVRGWKSLNVEWLASITPTPAGTRQPTNAEAAMIEYAAKRQELLDGYQ